MAVGGSLTPPKLAPPAGHSAPPTFSAEMKKVAVQGYVQERRILLPGIPYHGYFECINRASLAVGNPPTRIHGAVPNRFLERCVSQDEVLHYLHDIAQCSIGSRLKEVKYPLGGATQSLAGPGVRESEAIGGASLAFGHALVFEDWPLSYL